MVSAYRTIIVLWVIKMYAWGIRLHLPSIVCFLYSSFVLQICVPGIGIYDSFVLTAVKSFIYKYTIVDLLILLVNIFINSFLFLSLLFQ